MKMKKLAVVLSLALGALASPLAAVADGDIVDIRAVDSTARTFGGSVGRNRMSDVLCTPDNPLVAGETLCIRVRMLVRNAEAAAAGAEPLTWKFWDKNKLEYVSDPGAGVKLGLMIGERQAYADYSLNGLNSWEFSGELRYDDTGAATTNYRYFTDFYFKYTVKAGDMGLPIRLMDNSFKAASSTRSTTDYAFYGLNVGIDGFSLRNADGDAAELHYVPEGALDVDWPNGPWKGTVWDGRYANYDLANEGICVKTIDFDNEYASEEVTPSVWRYVHGGGVKGNDATVVVQAGATAVDGATVYVWSTNETVVVPALGLQGTKLEEIEVMPGVSCHVLTVQVPPGGDTAAFRLKAGAGATVGAQAKVFMSPNKTAVYDAAGTAEDVSVNRLVEVTATPAPSVNLRLDGRTTKKVKAGPDYADAYAAKLTVNIENDDPARKTPVAVSLKASVDGSTTLATIDALFSRNFLRISKAEGYDLMAKAKDVTIPVGESSVTLYVYVLGASEETGEPGIRFEPVCTDVAVGETAAATLYVDCPGEEGVGLAAKNPSSGATVTVEEGGALKFTATVADTYQNMKNTATGYTFYLDDVTAGGDADNFLTKTKVVPKASGEVTVTGTLAAEALGGKTYQVELWALAPDGVSTTKRIPFNLKVTDGRKVVIEPASGVTTIGEGEEMPFNLYLNQSYVGAEKYMFVRGFDATSSALFTSALTTTGALIDKDRQYVTGTRNVKFLDGGDGTAVTLVAFASDAMDDPAMEDYAWTEGKRTISVTNKPPVLNSLTIAGKYLTSADNGKKLSIAVPMGVAQTFKIGTVGDVAADLDATGDKAFKTKFIIEGQEYFITGNPKDQSVTHTFASAADETEVQVFLKDKDMLDYPTDPSFRCSFKVTDKPNVQIETSAIGGIFLENETSGALIELRLSEPPSENVEVKLTVQNTASGYLRLRTSEGSVTNALDAAGNVLSNVYLVAFAKGVKVRSVMVAEMDGTNDTLAGLDINAEVATAAWSDYYTKAVPVTVHVQNVPPQVLRPNDYEVSFTNENASVNAPYLVSYGAKDVAADLNTSWTYLDRGVVTGVVVSIEVDGSVVWTDCLTSSIVRTAPVTFQSEGTHTLTIVFTDKELESSYRTMIFKVKPAKLLDLRAHGPADAVATTGGYSQHYGLAAGLGAGRVYAGQYDPVGGVSRFVHSYSFNPDQSDIRAYARAYKADGRYDDGTLGKEYGPQERDRAIDRWGCWTNNQVLAKEDCYNYTLHHRWGQRGYDSFVYGWACNNTSESTDSKSSSSGETTTTTMSFLMNIGSSGEMTIPFPAKTEGGKDNAEITYPKQNWEAVFSREWLKTDNCGDINQDGVPDAAVYVYGMGVVDSTGKLVGAGGASGDGTALPEGDLTDLKDWNGDVDKDGNAAPDFLPNTGTALFSELIPGLKETWVDVGEPFGAKLEIRGYGDGLNDAATLLSLGNDIESDIVYAVSNEVTGAWEWSPDCTISKLEFLAWQEFAAKDGCGLNEWMKPATNIYELSDAGEMITNVIGKLRWSPERPTRPTLEDTDGDGFSDGYEYYFWYKAHVGYIDANGVHRYLTGRAYDPRNPGHGKFISSAMIARMMDPRSDLPAVDMPEGFFEDASKAETRDTDNDGLPDLLEFEIGTNPFDFDTDGDGLPDGFEILLNGTDPLLAYTTKGIADGMRNYDGDAMAFTTPALEAGVLPAPLDTKLWVSFATMTDAFDGDTDGLQWYVTRDYAFTNYTYEVEEGKVFQVGGVRYFTKAAVGVTEDGRLATDLTRDAFGKPLAYAVICKDELKSACKRLGLDGVTEDYLRLAPTVLTVGTQLEAIEHEVEVPPAEEGGDSTTEKVKDWFVDAKATVVKFAAEKAGEPAMAHVNSAWVYGRDTVSTETGANAMLSQGGFGMLMLGRYLDVPDGAVLAQLPDLNLRNTDRRTVALAHYLVYQEFGFDPRTAWNAHTPLAPRWGRTVNGETVESQYSRSYAGVATRTREFTAYDEFLLLSFFLNNGKIALGEVTASQANPWATIWSKYTTNPQGPGELWETDNENYKGRTAETDSGTNGADTDRDGVPDGWELYVMAGPKQNVKPYGLVFNFAGPYNDNHWSHFGPFEGDAASASWTDASGTSGYASLPGDYDELTELQEFAGTDSCNYYSKPQEGNKEPFSTTIVRPKEHASWLNKFFPTDPWTADTDGDGIDDGWEIKSYRIAGTTAEFKCGNFIYGTPVDNGSTSIPGGGLNPLTIDTDGDGLPDLWESQFAGSKIYDGMFVEKTKDADGNEGNPKQGLCDGMDGTVADAFTSPVIAEAKAGETTNSVWWVTDSTAPNNIVNRDYDHDGLENWQEYMTGLMRCWRYDDPLSPWGAVDDDLFYVDGEFSVQKAAETLFPGDPDGVNRFWYETLVNTQGDYYNPFLLSGMSPANYLTRVKNGWDKAFPTEQGKAAYYWLPHRIGDAPIEDLWCDAMAEKHLPIGEGMAACPYKYACCSPIDPDSDHDGMDDYYELFHGLNPLRGASGRVNAANGGPTAQQQSVGPSDLVYDAWYNEEAGALEAWAASADAPTANYWQRHPDLAAKRKDRFAKRGLAEVENGYDFEVYPWLNGLQTADPDGDDIRNLMESIQPKLSGNFYLHTDPTPLWMTDSTYTNSLTRLFFRMQTREKEISLDESFTYNGKTWWFRDFDGYVPRQGLKPPVFAAFTPDQWRLEGLGSYNWMYSFEENEGFDTDHDSLSDYEEAQGSKHSASDAQDADSPRRRQALYFPDDAEKPGLVVSMPEEPELHPLGASYYPDDDAFLNYTVELWVKPNRTDVDQTVFERAIWVDKSKTADKEFMRKGFQLAIKGGKWYTKYDTNGTDPTDTLSGKTFECVANNAATTDWTHIAVRYDGTMLTLFVNGVAKSVAAHLAPVNDTVAMVFRSDKGHFGEYWYSRKYKYAGFVFGASLKGREEAGDEAYKALDPTEGAGLGYYRDFFRGGFIDEVRVWDGARAPEDIIADYESRKRYDRADALENRSAFYKAWKSGKRIPELRHHWSFDSVPGAENAEQVAKWPHGFQEEDGPVMSRPEGYEISWWKKTAKAYGSVYAGFYDWVTWIPDTLAHLPHYDGTTLDSFFWSSGYAGDEAGTYVFPMTAEPVSRWTQLRYGKVTNARAYWTTGTRHRFVNELVNGNASSTLFEQFEFAGRNRVQTGNDLLPLGGAFVKYAETMWDDQGASSVWEQTGDDANANGLPDWWEAYADQNYRPDDLPPGTVIGWNTEVVVDGVRMTAGEAYLRDLANGMYVGSDGTWHAGPTVYAQTAKADGLIPDWWKDLNKITGVDPLFDSDNDGLNNYIEYVASETLPFGLRLNPLEARSNTKTLDYFRKVGKLYVGEMLTDHDQMEDHWERSLGDETVADATIWDALKDADADGWTNFAENRYNGMRMSTLAQLVSHAMGDVEALDAPMPSIKLTVRYNGRHFSAGKTESQSDQIPDLIVRTFTAPEPASADATFVLKPGTEVERNLYLGGWEDRVIRGTMAPGNIDIGSLRISFAQVPQSDKYSWTDESGLHLARPYAEFKEALARNPDIVQNLQGFAWLDLAEPVIGYEGITSEKAVTIARDELTQKGHIAVYGERVGTVDLTTGDFEFDLSAMSKIRPNDKDGLGYTFATDPRAAWSYKEAIFRFTYKATIPKLQADRLQVSLAKADKGFVKGGRNTIMAFFDNDKSGTFTPGEPFGVLKDVEIGWYGRALEMELTDMSGITPRVDLWSGVSDRETRWGDAGSSNRIVAVKAATDLVHVRVVRHKIDGQEVNAIGVEPRVLLDRTFDREAATFLQEGDFTGGGSFDIDWNNLLGDVSHLSLRDYMLTNVTYLVVLGDGPVSYEAAAPGQTDTNATITALSTPIERRFEATRSAPTPAIERCVFTKAAPTFAWKLDNEDKVYAARFGTTYTAFKVVVKSGSTTVYDSGVNGMPACDAEGVYRWTAPLYVGSASPSHPSVTFENLANYTWEVYVYNAKFKTDANGSAPQTFRMNVTTSDTSSQAINVGVSYAGPATQLAGKVRVQAFASPDFTGNPAAEVTVGGSTNKVRLAGLAAGSYFVCAYIDTNGNGRRDDWESWGYLCERDRANKAGIFNPVAIESKFSPNEKDVLMVYIEDCDTDGDWFPDAWEAEQNGGEFVPFKTGAGQGPVTGNKDLIGVNPNLDAKLSGPAKALMGMRQALTSPNGVAMMTGVDAANVVETAGGFEVASEVDPDTLTITGLRVDAAQNRVLLTVGAETTAPAIDGGIGQFLNVTVRKGADVTVRIERADAPNGVWTAVPGVSGTVTVDRAGTEIKVDLKGELPAQGFFRAVIEK